MKPRFLGTTICLLLRSHKWRRLRKAETEMSTDGINAHRVCSRCGIRRAVKTRMPKEAP